MLTISQRQMDALEAATPVTARLTAWLKDSRPDRFGPIPQGQLHHMVRTLAQRAKTYGVTEPQAIYAFAALAADFASDFDRHPEVQRAFAELGPEQGLVQIAKAPEDWWRWVAGQGAMIGWRLAQPMWKEPAPIRVAFAVVSALESAALPACPDPNAAVAAARSEAGELSASEDGVFVAAVYAAVTPRSDQRRAGYAKALATASGAPAVAASALRLRLFLDHKLWV